MTVRFRVLAGSLLPLILLPWTAASQAAPSSEPGRLGIRDVRLNAAVLGLAPRWTRGEGLPNGRVTVTSQEDPNWSVHLGAVRLGQDEYSVLAGGFGARYAMAWRSVRVGPFVEIGFGELRAHRDEREIEYFDRWGELQQEVLPAYRSTKVLGAGAGLDGEFALTRSVAARFTIGYWRYPASTAGVEGVFAGLGLAWTWRDAVWYWAKGGRDTEGPRVALASPPSDTMDAVDPGLDALAIRATDLSGISSVEVNDLPVRFETDPAVSGGPRVDGTTTVIARADPAIAPGHSDVVRIAAVDGAGNRTETRARVLGPPIDRDPPQIVTLADSVHTTLRQPASIHGFITDQSPLASVEVIDAVELTLREGHEPVEGAPSGHQVTEFSARVPMERGRNGVRIVAEDTAGHRSAIEQTVIFRSARPPFLEILYPENGAEIGEDRVDVIGRIVHPFPLDVVAVGAIAAEVREIDVPTERGPLDDRVYLFHATVPLRTGPNRVRVLARDADGLVTTLTLRIVRGHSEDGSP